MGVAALRQLAQVVEWTDEGRLLGVGLFHALGALVAAVVLQVGDVLQTFRVLTRLLYACSYCATNNAFYNIVPKY